MARIFICPSCRHSFAADQAQVQAGLTCPECGASLANRTVLVDLANDSTALEPPWSPDSFIGRDIGGCRLEAKIGQGGMGTVFRAHHRALDIPVAVKILPDVLAETTPDSIERLFREARAAAQLQHQNIVGVLNVGEDSGVHFIVMQYVDGENLQQRVARCQRLPVDEVVAIMIQVCDGLEKARQRGIVHRDIKPSNIMIDQTGTAKLADLGLAKNCDSDTDVTHSGMAMGTPQFMSPEQFRDTAHADHRSDLYSLGCTFYWAVCGEAPYTGATIVNVMQQHQSEPVPDPRSLRADLPAPIASIIIKLMAKEPAQRYRTAGEVAERLRASRHVETEPTAQTDEAPDLDGARVLVVDDLRPIRFFFKTILKRANAQVDEAQNGAEALQLLTRACADGRPFDLLITDVHMPGMDGLALLREVRNTENLRETPVIVITMEEDQSVVLQFAQIGISSYLVKPPKAHEVLVTAKSALDASAGSRAHRRTSTATGLTCEETREMYRLLTAAISDAIEKKGCPCQSIFESPVYVSFIEFLQRHCPQALE